MLSYRYRVIRPPENFLSTREDKISVSDPVTRDQYYGAIVIKMASRNSDKRKGKQ